jgi:hypothetical protein
MPTVSRLANEAPVACLVQPAERMSKAMRAYAKAAGKARQAVSALSGKVGILNTLEGEHQELSILVDRLVALGQAGDGVTALDLLDIVRRELLLHSEAEQAVFYSALAELERSRAWVEHHEATHEEISDLLDALARVPVDEPEWSVLSLALRDALDDHIDDEEGELFDLAQELLPPEALRELGSRYGKRRHDLAVLIDRTAGPGHPAQDAHHP